ncbi:MAG: hypothetical protein M1817_005246 [Caeruleum heppii]|nr:MAG: hypothetical protein M1817_005246 [Caeruleum heppii]
MDPIKSLSFITDNSDDWINRLDDLTGQIASRQAELAQLSARPLSRPKHGSTESLRPGADNTDVDNPFESAAAMLAGAARQYQAQQLRRKRKTASLASAASGTDQYRTRSMIIVYYDSAVQEAFEGIVRNIGTARNNVRKGRMAAAMKKVTAVPDTSSGLGDDADAIRSRMAFGRMSRSRGGEEKTVYDDVDSGLEFAQSMCERGAHQFLRDGDCAPEILSIRKRLEDITRLASGEITKLRAVEEKEKQRQRLTDAAKGEEETAVAQQSLVPHDIDSTAPVPPPATLEVDPDA